jgi:hypothetical protein
MALSRQNNSRIPTRSVALRQLAARVASPPVVRQAAMIVASASNFALMREVRLLRAVETGPHDFPIAGETAIKCDAHANDSFQREPAGGTAIVNGVPRGFGDASAAAALARSHDDRGSKPLARRRRIRLGQHGTKDQSSE